MKAIVLLLLLLLGLPVFSGGALATTPGEVAVGSVLRDAPLYGLFHDFRMLSDFRGKPLVINVWASWCGPCRLEMGSLQRLAKRVEGKQFNVIGISTDDNSDAAAAFLRRSGITFDNYVDRKLVLENMLGANTIPLTVLVDADGRVVRKIYGAHEWDSPEFLNLIGKAFGVRM